MGRVTLQTIADQVGVSRMTVSNAFSRPGQLSAQLRDQILGVAEALGYVGPDPTARALASGTTGAVGLVLSDTLSYALTDEVATTFLAGIAEELTPTGLALTLLPGEGGEGGLPARDIAMDGALVYSCNPDSTAASWLIRRRIPLVLVDQEPMPGISSINISDRLGAKAAAQHIVDLGHRRVALVTIGFAGESGIVDDVLAAKTAYSQRERLAGWLEPLTAAGIEPVVVRQLIGDQDDAGYAAAELLLARDERPTAILCFSDAIARGVVRAIQDAGLSVPDDISVVGFDDNPIAHRSQPTLTTVRQDANAKGRAAVAALMTAIEKAKTQPTSRGRHIVLPTELVVRESTARPPKSQRRPKAHPKP
jgi:DNA-binding LacI/PurR family transcriptional regulator